MGPYGVNSLHNGILDGYSAHAHTTSIIILNIMMNDGRNGTEYQCGMIRGLFLEQESDAILLYVAGGFQCFYSYESYAINVVTYSFAGLSRLLMYIRICI